MNHQTVVAKSTIGFGEISYLCRQIEKYYGSQQ